jgi:predicted Na+-dependent transporter
VYPTPTFIYPKQKLTNDFEIDTIWSMEGVTMDITNLIFRLDVFYDDDTSFSHIWSLNILVTQPKRRIDKIFYIMIPFIVVSISILMGVLLDTTVIVGIFKKPIPVLIGFVAQYGLMPFLAMAIAKIFRYTPLNSLALFICGCCPGKKNFSHYQNRKTNILGSGASNQWTVLFDGDVNLSAVMSFVSTTASFIMMPLYLYTLGKLYMDDLAISVPFWGLARSLVLVVIPYSIGITISHFVPKSRPFVEKLIKPMMIILMLFFLSFGLVVNWYLFKTIDLYTTLTAPLLPFLGFLFGGLIAWITCMDWKRIKTIGIEAGIQNTGIAFMIIMYSFPQAYATKALVVPMIVAFLSTKPFWILLIIRNQIIKYQKRKELTKKENTDGILIINNDKPSLNNEENHKKDYITENMQQL